MVRKNIAIMVQLLDYSGKEIIVYNLIKNIDRDYYRIVLICLREYGDLGEKLRDSGEITYNLENRGGFSMETLKNLVKVLKKENIEIIHAHDAGSWYYAFLSSFFYRKAKIIVTRHGLEQAPSLKEKLEFLLLSLRTKQIVAVSQCLKNDILKNEKINSKKVTIINNGIDIKKFSRKYHTIPFDVDAIKIRGPVIGTVGRCTEVKNHEFLIRSMPVILKKIPDAVLIIIGTIDTEMAQGRKLINMIKTLGLESSVYFLGEKKDVTAYLNVFNVFVLSSKYEGISVSLLEAMAAKVPVVATDVGGNKEILTDYYAGFLVPLDDINAMSQRILKILSSKSLTERLSATGYERIIKQFSIEQMIKNYEQLYSEVLSYN